VVFDAGYDSAQLTLNLANAPVLSDAVFGDAGDTVVGDGWWA
jgi:hypothetical protein